MIVTESNEGTKLYLLVGGKGTRLTSVTTGPKCLVDIKGKPFLDYVLDNLCGFDVVLVCSDINYHYFQPYEDRGIKVFNEGEPSGTAGFLMKVDAPESFYVMNGDTYYAGDINLDATKSTIFVNLEEIKGDEGYIIGGNDGRVEAYIEKEPHAIGQTHFVNLGIYKLYKKDITLPMRLPLSMEYDILPNMNLSYGILKSDRFDIGTPERLEKFKKWFV